MLLSFVTLLNAHPGIVSDNSLDEGKVHTTHSVEQRPVPVPVYQKVPVEIPSPVPVAVPNYVKVQM